MLEYKQKRNNGRTPFAGVYKFECVCVCVCVYVVRVCVCVSWCGVVWCITPSKWPRAAYILLALVWSIGAVGGPGHAVRRYVVGCHAVRTCTTCTSGPAMF